MPISREDVLDRFFSTLEKVQETSEELAPLREHRSREEAANRIGTIE